MKDKEIRSLTGSIEIESREDGKESRTITGYGIVFDKWSEDLGWFREKISRDAADDALSGDIVATFNHDFNSVMARTSSNTLTLTTDDHGVRYTFEAPNTTSGNDLLENVRNGNVKGSSFIFRVKEDRWTFSQEADKLDEREILKIDKVFEVGPVVMPAYPDTTAARRSHDDQLPKPKDDTNDRRLRKINLKFIFQILI